MTYHSLRQKFLGSFTKDIQKRSFIQYIVVSRKGKIALKSFGRRRRCGSDFFFFVIGGMVVIISAGGNRCCTRCCGTQRVIHVLGAKGFELFRQVMVPRFLGMLW